ncbi:hypothetical protein [Embleya scabrispora]|uniref:hypothetical protein n=1 Tax=Embleya scabrispora TaxID=159449 RepID=UPI00036DAB45|nr:hypothetical protein [Embleya scabrispora]
MMHGGRLPMGLVFASLLLTFLVTRTITRLIRAGRGPFRNVSSGGVHIHHVVPGIVLVLIGGFLAVGTGEYLVARAVAGVVLGIGAGLVLDEFGMIVHLADVYWTEQGRISIEATVLTVAAVGLAASGFVPFDATPEGDAIDDRVAWVVVLLLDVVMAAITFAKGKVGTGVIGVFIPIVNIVAGIRLARPGSPWARRYYRDKPRKLRRATARAARRDARWKPIRRRFEDTIAGRLVVAPALPSVAPTPEPRGRREVHGARHTWRRVGAGAG